MLNSVLCGFCVIDGYLQFAGPKTYSFGSTTDSSAAANIDKSVLKASISLLKTTLIFIVLSQLSKYVFRSSSILFVHENCISV